MGEALDEVIKKLCEYENPPIKAYDDSKIKPCPFCGYEEPYYVSGQHCILCPVCLNEMTNETTLTKEDLIQEWNRRVKE